MKAEFNALGFWNMHKKRTEKEFVEAFIKLEELINKARGIPSGFLVEDKRKSATESYGLIIYDPETWIGGRDET